MTNEKKKEINLGDDFGAVTVNVNGKSININADGTVAQRALEIGEHVDGMIVLDVDYKNNTALFVPEDDIFAGESDFKHRNDLVEQANTKNLNGHSDWRAATGKEAYTLAEHWRKVAPREWQTNISPRRRFWGEAYEDHEAYKDSQYATTYCGGVTELLRGRIVPRCSDKEQTESYLVPIVRSGPAFI